MPRLCGKTRSLLPTPAHRIPSSARIHRLPSPNLGIWPAPRTMRYEIADLTAQMAGGPGKLRTAPTRTVCPDERAGRLLRPPRYHRLNRSSDFSKGEAARSPRISGVLTPPFGGYRGFMRPNGGPAPEWRQQRLRSNLRVHLRSENPAGEQVGETGSSLLSLPCFACRNPVPRGMKAF